MSQRKRKSGSKNRLESIVLATAIIKLLITIINLIEKIVD